MNKKDTLVQPTKSRRRKDPFAQEMNLIICAKTSPLSANEHGWLTQAKNDTKRV